MVHAAISAAGEVEAFVLAVPHSAYPQVAAEEVAEQDLNDPTADAELNVPVAFITPDGDQLSRLCDSCPGSPSTALPRRTRRHFTWPPPYFSHIRRGFSS